MKKERFFVATAKPILQQPANADQLDRKFEEFLSEFYQAMREDLLGEDPETTE